MSLSLAFRMVFVAVGNLLAGAGGPALIETWGGDRAAYAAAGFVLAGLCGAAMLATVWASRSARVEPGVRGLSFRASLRGVVGPGPFRTLGTAYFLQMVSNGANAAMLAYAAQYLLGGGEALVGLFFAVFTVASLAGTPVFAALGQRWGRRAGLVRATWIYAASLALLIAAVPAGEPTLLAAAALAGLGNAGTQLFAFALLPDAVDADRQRTGLAREGLLTGIWIAGEKLGLAAGAAAAGLALGLSGYVGGGATQSGSALVAIAVLFSIGPAILMVASIPLLRRLDIKEDGYG